MSNSQSINNLNSSQYKAVAISQGAVLVIAGAGSGKTKVIESRCSYLVKSGVRPESILLLTFTKRAAREMIERATKSDARCRAIDGGTFHSFASKVLRQYADVAGIKSNFAIWDDGDTEDAIKRCMKQVIPRDAVGEYPSRDELVSLFGMLVNKSLTLEQAVKEQMSGYEDMMPDIRTIFSRYTTLKQYANALDYDDLLKYLKKVLDNSEARKRLSSKFQYIMVDEYQDTNKIQSDIVYHLASVHGNVMAVGDDAQSIYAFRGAVVENILRFPNKFTGCTVIKLEQNYRSTQPILDMGNCVLADMKNKYDKKLTAATGKTGGRPVLMEFADEWEEAKVIVDKVQAHVNNGGRLRDIAVLFRSAYVSLHLQGELLKKNIPFKLFGGKKLTDSGHVRDMLALLKAFSNMRNEVAWFRALSFVDGIGAKTAAKIISEIAQESSIEGVGDVIVKLVSKKSKEGAERFKKLLLDMAKTSTPGEQFVKAMTYYSPILKAKYNKVEKRKRDFTALKNMAERYEDLNKFLSDITVDAEEARENESAEFLTLSTIHSAKGLEWDKVFLIGIQDGVFPSAKSSKEEEVEEEKRLLYVAITRAREQLHLCYWQKDENGLCRFISGDVMESLDVKTVETETTESRVRQRQEGSISMSRGGWLINKKKENIL